MGDEFDRAYWQRHWSDDQTASGEGPDFGPDANPYVVREASALPPGSALDAGCGAGAEAIWLAASGWSVTGVDISASALAQASARTVAAVPALPVTWVEADLTEWEPAGRFDLVVTSYAHPATSQLEFYERLSRWVAPGGSLLIVGHLHDPETPVTSHRHPESSLVTVADIVARFSGDAWSVVAAEEHTRDVSRHGGETVQLRDAVVRVVRSA